MYGFSSEPTSLLASLAGDETVSELLSDTAQISAMVKFELNLALAQAQLGIIPAEAAKAIKLALKTYTPNMPELHIGLKRDGVIAPELVKQLRAHVGTEHGQYLHVGATSQDLTDTAFALQTAQILGHFDHRLTLLERKLEKLIDTYGEQPLMAHTRMQVALPFTVEAKLQTWLRPISRYRDVITEGRSFLALQLGGPIGDRSSFGELGDDIAEIMADELELAYSSPFHSERDQILGLFTNLALISGTMGKIGADIALMAQNEVASINIAGGGTSSAMAHKSNPVNAEILVSLARFNASLTSAAQNAMVHENERSGAAWTLEWLTLPQILMTTGASLRMGLELLEQISFSEKTA